MSKEVYEIRFRFKQGKDLIAFPKNQRFLEIGKALQEELKKTCEIIEGLDHRKKNKLTLTLNSRTARYYYCLVESIRQYVNKTEIFGICDKCLKDIPLERLKMVPVCKHCVSCKHS